MKPSKSHSVDEFFRTDLDRRKRLGQYFTGVGLARVLAALADASKAKSIIDPMAGSGDMLESCLDLGARPSFLAGIEIDHMAAAKCSERVVSAKIICDNAFDPKTIRGLPKKEWDLVITNPPYVRYQSFSNAGERHYGLPGALEIRNGLMKSIDEMTALDEIDRDLFRKLVSGYSGLADLAVPSWILCAGLVGMGGRLALVVPESWLSRDYASVVQYILLKWFRIEFVVEDEHAVWFGNTQVKTNLIVARRVERRPNAFNWEQEDTFLRLRVSGWAAKQENPIARCFPNSSNGAIEFAAEARKELGSRKIHKSEFVSPALISMERTSKNIKSICSRQKWLSGMDDGPIDLSGLSIPDCIADWLSHSSGCKLVPLESLGVSVGQGLRTGANDFFYSTVESIKKNKCKVVFDLLDKKHSIEIPSAYIKPVLRKQAELPAGFVVNANYLLGRVSDLRNVALPEDLRRHPLAGESYKEISPEVAAFIRMVMLKNFGTEEDPKRISDLSAVAPNVRNASKSKGTAPRYWYMLPNFTGRHVPDLLIPRINNFTPRAWLNKGRKALVDANFSTLHIIDRNSVVDPYALLALLNSTWFGAMLEWSAAVMGGGALKVEATHLRHLAVPKLNDFEWKKMSRYGRQLAQSGHGMAKIDFLLTKALLGKSMKRDSILKLKTIANEGLVRRKNHKGRL